MRPAFEGPFVRLRDVLEPESDVPPEFFVSDEEELQQWKYLKGAKKEQREHRASGTPYFYSEGAIPYPDDLDDASRTILTGEGGGTPSRFEHLIPTSDGRMRRLTRSWNGSTASLTATGRQMPDANGPCAWNALVVGVVEKLAASLAAYASEHTPVAARA